MKSHASAWILSALLLAGFARGSAPTQPSSARNVIVYYEPGRFGGWPANNAAWSWGDEIAIGFIHAWYAAHDDEHSVDRSRPGVTAIARSTDGGETWSIEDHPELQQGEGRTSPGGIDFTNPGFAMRVRDEVFYVSYDLGRTWQGPWSFTDFGLGRLTSRTDYLVQGKSDCLVFLSIKDEKVQSGIPDRAFAARTTDGGKTFKFLGWMTGKEPILARSVMPATVRANDGALVSLMRRRFDLTTGYRNDINWIDAYRSTDDGVTWAYQTRIAYTDLTQRNGNPPSLVKLPDGRLAAAYGVRRAPSGIFARVSRDNGLSWGPELVLRDDARKWDMGYCRSVVRADGRIVTAYYYTTNERPEQHIEATIWTP